MFTPIEFGWQLTVQTVASRPIFASNVEPPDEYVSVTIQTMVAWLNENNIKFYSEVSWKVPRMLDNPAYDLAFCNENDIMMFTLRFSENIIKNL